MKTVVIMTFVGISLASCEGAAEDRLRIATDATFPPFHSLDDRGEATGFDTALARAVAEHAGYEAEVIVVDYDELFAGLTAGRHDVIAATTGITPSREQEYLFTRPYYETCQAAVVRNAAGEPGNVVDLHDRRLGAAGSGTSMSAMFETLAEEYVRIGEGEGPDKLAAHEIDAWIVDEFVAVQTARASLGRFRVLSDPVAPERYGFVLALDRRTLKARLDESLDALDADGTIARLRREFGVDRDSEWPIDW